MLFVAVVALGLVLVGGAAVLRMVIGSGTVMLIALGVACAFLVVGSLALGLLVGVDSGDGASEVADRPAPAPAPAPETIGDDDELAVEHDPARLRVGLGVAALMLIVAAALLRGTDWTPVGPDPWDDDTSPAGGRVGSRPTAAPR
ncbi:MAG: hypothetical protein ACSLFP_19215 [Acidimicrobiales bacterium]